MKESEIKIKYDGIALIHTLVKHQFWFKNSNYENYWNWNSRQNWTKISNWQKNGVSPQCVFLRVSNDSSLQYCCSEFLLDIQDAEKMTSDWWKRNDDHCSHAIRNPYIYTMASFFRPTKSKFLHMKKTHVSITDEENEKNFNDEHLRKKALPQCLKITQKVAF